MAAAPHRSVASVNRRKHRRLQIFRSVVLVGLGIFFLVPIGAMIEFSTRGVGINAPRTLSSFTGIFAYPDLTGAIWASLELAIITSVAMLVLLLPTMVWVRLRVPRMVRVIEVLCLAPLTIPAIVLVVGLAPLYQWININLSDSILTLGFAYLILVLPYAYRALDAGLSGVDVRTLSEAGRSLGAGWATVVWRIIVPNMSSAVLNACLLSVAVVLGEFTIANLLNFENLQVAIALIGRANAGVSIAVAVASLLFVFVLLLALSFVPRPGSRRRRVEVA
jgi:putative spermidine/putrescine transport system permease protein